MKLTPREKILLIVFGIVAFLAASYFLVLDPQLTRIEELKTEEETYNQKLTDVNLEIASGAALKKSLEQMDLQIQEQSKRFYPDILEPQLIVLMDDLIGKAEVDVNSITLIPETIGTVDLPKLKEPQTHPLEQLAGTYKVLTGNASQEDMTQQASGTVSPNVDAAPGDELAQPVSGITAANAGTAPTDEKVQPAPGETTLNAGAAAVIEKMTITIEYDKTSYDQIRALVKGLESQDRTLVIDSLSMEAGEGDLLKGSVSVTFYALPKLHDQDTEYLGWPYTDVYGKTDPFR